MKMTTRKALLLVVGITGTLWACTMTLANRRAGGRAAVTGGTCQGPYPNYWQDPKFTSTGMWQGQQISNQPPANWTGSVFQLSQQYPTTPPDDPDQPWLLFNPFNATTTAARLAASEAYLWAVMKYIQAGNIPNGSSGGNVENDWTLCNNSVRSWYHMPFQTYVPSSGREFMHGLTREAPVTFKLPDGSSIQTTVWAVGFYNPRAAYALGQVWSQTGTPAVPTSNFAFPEGTVIGKLLFTTATPAQISTLTNLPQWQANISAPSFCTCTPSSGETSCSFQEISQQCPRSPSTLTLMQFDVAVRDNRAPLGWAYGTFVADGIQKASEPNPWNRISPLGLMWGNSPPPAGGLASQYPVNPLKNGFTDAAISWDVVGRWNQVSDGGHLGCNSRLNGPADNPSSSCLSCHMTASVPDKNRNEPPIFLLPINDKLPPYQCYPPSGYPMADAVYFANTNCSQPFQGGGIVPPPQYANGQTQWISTDFSLQLASALNQWLEWKADQVEEPTGPRHLKAILPAR
jgi:hypothetical protein